MDSAKAGNIEKTQWQVSLFTLHQTLGKASSLFAISLSFQQLNLARLPLEYDLKGQDKSSSFRCMFGNTYLAFSILITITMKLISDLMYVICNIYFVNQYSPGLEWERMGLTTLGCRDVA